LPGHSFGFLRTFSIKTLHSAKLLVSDLQDTNGSEGRKGIPCPLDVDFGILLAGARANVDRVLHHLKSIFQEVFPKLGRAFPLGFGSNWQIKENPNPHRPKPAD